MISKQEKYLIIFAAIFVFFIFLPYSFAESAYGPSIKKDNYEISRSFVKRDISVGNIFKDSFTIYNLLDKQIKVSFSSVESIKEILELETTGTIIEPKNFTLVYFTITGKNLGNFQGKINIAGDISENIEVNITITNESLNPEILVDVSLQKKNFPLNGGIVFKIELDKIIGTEIIPNVTFSYSLINKNQNTSISLGNESMNIKGSLQLTKEIKVPSDLKEDYYVLQVITDYKNRQIISSNEFYLKTPFRKIKLFGFLPIWLLTILFSLLVLSIASFTIIRKEIEKNKKYKMQLYTKNLPKKSENTLLLGRVAETNIPAYLEMDALTTHAVVAGATGGGKSITAQTLIEEVLLKNIAVIVFDPTAQWSGMLRKCEDKKMLSFYPKFNLKPSDARAFPGNVRQVINERQAIDIRKYFNPGQIQIFTMNKLTPPQIDTFVATVIASIFKSDPKEFPGLRVMLVFDEVHRLLPKFGGSGKGFLQIERACREFRKWGFGVMLVSQVLSDFVGEIKANINTEVQMRTRDEADLNRIKTKYGEEFLQSLIKASVGVGMFVNPRYNKGKPYFINYRPILHNTRRLSDQVLEQYNKYNDDIEDIEYQIEQLEQEKIDTFDIKMELKLVKDKLMTGNFTVVDIYLEGLKPRVEKHWQNLGKKPKKKELELVDVSVVESSLKQAQKTREELEKQENKENKEVKKEDTAEIKKEEIKKVDEKLPVIEEIKQAVKLKKSIHKDKNKKTKKK